MKGRARIRTVVILLVLASAGLPVAPRTDKDGGGGGGGGGQSPTYSNLPTALVVDPCRAVTDADHPELDRVSEVTMIDFLSTNPPVDEVGWVFSNTDPHGGVAFASLPHYAQSHVFVTRGDRLDVYDIGTRNYEELVYERIRSVSVGGLIGVPGLQLGRVAAGGYVPFEPFPGALGLQASLYVIGTRPDLNRAYYAVIDQQWLIEGSAPSSTVVYDSGQICAAPGCVTSAALDVRVGDVGNIDFTEEVYITTAETYGTTDLQMTYRLERGLGLHDFTLTPTFASYWNDALSPLEPPMVPDASGLRFAEDSRDVYVPRKFEWTVRNLYDSTESCVLPGEPTDVAVWEPGIASAEPRYLLAASWDGSIGRLDVFPAGACPVENPPSTLSLMVEAEPSSIDIYPVDNDELWALVVSKSGYFEAIHLDFDSDGVEDTFQVVESRLHDTLLDPPFEDSCPSFVQFGMRQETVTPEPTCPPGVSCTGLDRKCLRNDPRCP